MTEQVTYKPPKTLKGFIKDHRPGELFYDWVVGPVGCLPADSEFLTPEGWKRMDAYERGDQVGVYDPDTGLVGYERASYVKLPAREPFHVFDSGSLRMELSPEHTVLYRDYRGRQQTCTAAHMARHPSRRTIPTTFQLDPQFGAMRPQDESRLRLRVALSADGHIPVRGQGVRFALRKDRKKKRLRELLTACGMRWSEGTSEDRPTETRFNVHWPDAQKGLGFVWKLSTSYLKIVLDEIDHWDGLHDHAEKRFYTTSKVDADAVQYAAHATGRRAAIHVANDPRSEAWRPLYTVRIRTGDNAKNRAMVRAETRIETRETPDGWKYCFTTSTGFFVARCNGTVFITGNSGKTTALFFKLVFMARKQAPGPDGIRRSRAVIVRNTAAQLRDTTLSSWNYWFRDGQAGKWFATANKFTLKFGDVECEVLFRPLDTPDDVARVLSLEVTFAIIDEFVQVPKEIVDALSARCGRYPPVGQGGATNWGMWGSSNPDTEDNWWHDYLHGESVEFVKFPDDPAAQTVYAEHKYAQRPNAKYFLQPSGFSDEAENTENLPGGKDYYVNQAQGKTEAWIKQFLEAEWGFSAAGKPVVSSFSPALHLKKQVLFDDKLQLVAGVDPGISGTAFIFGQEDLHGRLRVLGELVGENMGMERFITERVRPFIRQRFGNAKLVVAPDPAAASRGQSDERSVVDVIKRFYSVKIESNNRLPKRLDAIEHFTARLTDVGPALMVDEDQCPVLTRALKGGWRYELDAKRGTVKGAAPEKNSYSHPGDAFGYLCRYFHRGSERLAKMPKGAARAQPRMLAAYHAR